MTKEQILARIDELLQLDQQGNPEPEELLNGALTLMIAAYGERSHQVKTLLDRRDAAGKLPPMPRRIMVVGAVQGSLRNLWHAPH